MGGKEEEASKTPRVRKEKHESKTCFKKGSSVTKFAFYKKEGSSGSVISVSRDHCAVRVRTLQTHEAQSSAGWARGDHTGTEHAMTPPHTQISRTKRLGDEEGN